MVRDREISFSIALEDANREVKEDERLELNGIHQQLIFADDINTLHEDTNTVKKMKKPCYMLVGRLV
jgi:hypothetical protein